MSKETRSYVGKIVSASRDKTVTVLVEYKVKHALYGKIIKKFKKFHAHDEENQYKDGDIVEISECCPISKTKTWKVKALVK